MFGVVNCASSITSFLRQNTEKFNWAMRFFIEAIGNSIKKLLSLIMASSSQVSGIVVIQELTSYAFNASYASNRYRPIQQKEVSNRLWNCRHYCRQGRQMHYEIRALYSLSMVFQEPHRKLSKKKPRSLKKKQLEELKHEVEMVILLRRCRAFFCQTHYRRLCSHRGTRDIWILFHPCTIYIMSNASGLPRPHHTLYTAKLTIQPVDSNGFCYCFSILVSTNCHGNWQLTKGVNVGAIGCRAFSWISNPTLESGCAWQAYDISL